MMCLPDHIYIHILDAIFTLSIKNITSDGAAGTAPCLYTPSVILQYLPCLCRAQTGELSGDKVWTNTGASLRFLRIAFIFCHCSKGREQCHVLPWAFSTVTDFTPEAKKPMCRFCQLPSVSTPTPSPKTVEIAI